MITPFYFKMGHLHQPLYYYVLLTNNTEIEFSNTNQMYDYVSKNHTEIKIVNGIVDEDCNGYTVFMNI